MAVTEYVGLSDLVGWLKKDTIYKIVNKLGSQSLDITLRTQTFF